MFDATTHGLERIWPIPASRPWDISSLLSQYHLSGDPHLRSGTSIRLTRHKRKEHKRVCVGFPSNLLVILLIYLSEIYHRNSKKKQIQLEIHQIKFSPFYIWKQIFIPAVHSMWFDVLMISTGVLFSEKKLKLLDSLAGKAWTYLMSFMSLSK